MNIITNLSEKINNFISTYGILKDNKLYIDFASIIECSYTRQIEVTDYPIEMQYRDVNKNYRI